MIKYGTHNCWRKEDQSAWLWLRPPHRKLEKRRTPGNIWKRFGENHLLYHPRIQHIQLNMSLAKAKGLPHYHYAARNILHHQGRQQKKVNSRSRQLLQVWFYPGVTMFWSSIDIYRDKSSGTVGWAPKGLHICLHICLHKYAYTWIMIMKLYMLTHG